jgi:hypothetical protein
MADGAAVNNNPGHEAGTNRRLCRGQPAIAPIFHFSSSMAAID